MDNKIEIVDFEKLDVYLIKGNSKNNPSDLQSIYQKSFQCWHETWDDFYNGEHHSNVKLNSNEFTRQDEVLALFYEGECFAITFFKEVDWRDSTAALDAYFNPWTPEALMGLRQQGDRILICSQFTVAKAFRNRKVDLPWKYILSGFNMKRFLTSDSNAMTGTMRVKKGMGRMSVEAGATPLALGVVCKDHEDEPADLVGFFHEQVKDVYEKNPYHSKFDAAWARLNGRLYAQLKVAA